MTDTSITTSLLNVKGNVSEKARRGVAKWSKLMGQSPYFANDILQQLTAVEMTVTEQAGERGKKQAQMVFELDVTEGTLLSLFVHFLFWR